MTLVGVLAGCSPLLGIEDPKPRTDAGDLDAPAIDAAETDAALIDAPAGDFLTLSVGEFKLANQQVVRLRVQRMLTSGGMEDVTGTATYSADNGAVTFGAKGTVQGAQAGSSTITVSLAGSRSAMVRATVSTFTCHPVINEFMTSNVSAANEFIEIYNPCTGPIDMTGWTLNYRGGNVVGTMDSNEMVKLTGMMAPGELRVYGGSAFPPPVAGSWIDSNGMGSATGAVGLRNAGVLVDSVAYGAVADAHPFAESNHPLVGMASGMSGSRLPFDGKDDAPDGPADGDNAANFQVIATPTPGALNVP
jgi:hypothetical protein